MALANAIMLAGAARAADDTTATTTTPPAKKTATQAATPAPATAQTVKPAAEATQLKPVVVTATPDNSYQATKGTLPYFTQPLVDTPGTITVVPQAVIRDQNATSLRDILRNVPGISFQAGEGSSTVAGDNLSIRGFNARDDMFIDGMRDTGIYTRDAFNTDSVEVVKGPASAYEGYGETGGSVNMASRLPELAPSYGVTAGVGTSTYDRESVDLNQPVTAFSDYGMAVRLDGFHQHDNVAARDYVYNSRWGFAPSIAWGLGTDTRVIASYLYQQENDLPDYGFPFVNAAAVKVGSFPQSQLNQLANLPYSNWYGFLYRDEEHAVKNMPTLTVEHDFDNGIKLTNQSRMDKTAFSALNTSARFDNPPPVTTPVLLYNMITREPSGRNDVDTLWDNKTYATIPFDTGFVHHDVVTSLEFSRETDNFSTATGQFVDTSMPNPLAQAPYPYPMVWTDTATNQLDDIALSAFDTVKFTPQWELTGGMRFDNLVSSYNDDGPKTPSHFARTDNLVSWRVAGVYKPAPNGSIYCGYGTAYNPSIQGISDGASNDALAANTVNLAPEEDISYELGTKWNVLDEKLSLNMALFRTDKTNARVVDPTQPGTVYTLSGVQRVQGVEVDVAGSITPEWKVFGGYVFMNSKVLSGPPSSYPGNSLPNAPQQSASLWMTYDLPWKLTLGTGWQYMDTRYAAVNELNACPGYWTQQAMLAYHVTKNFDLQLNVTNLWNKQYIDLVGAHQAVPGAGRTLVLTAAIHF